MSDKKPDEPDELVKLRRQIEQAKLTQELAGLATPWWRKAGVVTVVAALVAAILPVTTAIEEHFRSERALAVADAQKQRELELQAVRLQHDIRVSYLDRMDRDGSHLRTLRFLIKTSTDATLRQWAIEEKAVVEGKLTAHASNLETLEHELAATTDPARRKVLEAEIKDLKALIDAAAQVEPPSDNVAPML